MSDDSRHESHRSAERDRDRRALPLFSVAASEVDASARFNARLARAAGSIPTDSDFYDPPVVETERAVVFEIHETLSVEKLYLDATNWLRHHSL